ncbi:hypothetical protein L208DRAFT_1504476 [Tricholoma matsutake]|nr:hypothetical protein L208DRAFT_1504476 [Tricholoma matsutake 945]
MITGVALGALWQEFWELELLDNITTLQFMGKLPRKVTMADQRNQLIVLFREYKGTNYIPSTMHKAIKWSKTVPFPSIRRGPNKLHSRKISTPKNQHTISPKDLAPRKRKMLGTFCCPMPKLKMIKLESTSMDDAEPHSVNIPIGMQWQNNSCAYDAIFTILFNVWRKNPLSTQVDWQEIQSVELNELLNVFQLHESIPDGPSGPQYTLDQIREYMRHCLAQISASFTFSEYASVHSLLDCFLTCDIF